MKIIGKALRNKYLPALILFLIAFSATAQVYQKLPNRYQQRGIWVDSTFRVPFGDAPSLRDNIATSVPGALFYNIPDSGLYVYTGTQWIKLSSNLNFQAKLSSGNRRQYRLGNDSLSYFDQDVYAYGRQYFLPIDTTFTAAKISDFTAAVKALIPATSPGDTTASLTFQNGLQRVGNTVVAKYSIPIWNANKIQDKFVDATQPKSGETLVYDSANNILRWGPASATTSGASIPSYTEPFNGTTNNQFTVTRTPISSSIIVYVNGQKIPKSYYTLSVNTVQINAGLLTFTTDTNDKIEIVYQSTF